ncbi:hypothetical protein GT348_07185 [Aristophania vespae]|uniref:Uncharacterized protein n=1 Tax=Aristophania vespae TaxID=2697033 RepID=A0A6P1NCK7_9PROT|nr:hypothetical protein [Aristophania vespae]QHI96046.1 hypothetical protein GT348_07185 [Aristophania vespae]
MSKLIKTMLCAITLTYCVSARAEISGNEEAIKLLNRLHFSCDNHKKSDCEVAHNLLVKEYQNAFAGDYLAQRDVAAIIWEYYDKKDDVALEEACAWQTLVTQTKSKYKRSTDRLYLNLMCKPFFGVYNASDVPKIEPTVKKLVKAMKEIIGYHITHLVDIDEINFNVERDHDQAHAGLGWDD